MGGSHALLLAVINIRHHTNKQARNVIAMHAHGLCLSQCTLDRSLSLSKRASFSLDRSPFNKRSRVRNNQTNLGYTIIDYIIDIRIKSIQNLGMEFGGGMGRVSMNWHGWGVKLV